MRKIVLIPKRLHPSRFDPQMKKMIGGCLGGQCFYDLLRDELGFELLYDDTIANIPSDTSVLWCNFRDRHFGDVGKLKKGIKLVLALGDIHGDHGKWISSHSEATIRADVIISLMYARFIKDFPYLIKKHVYFPKCFQPHERYADLPFNQSPKMKCLITGRRHHELYLIRTGVGNYAITAKKKDDKIGNLIDVTRHYWYDRGKPENQWELSATVGETYAKRLNEYFCSAGIAGGDVGSLRYMLGTVVEIPATGALLLTQEVPDMKVCGFIPGKHYVPIGDTVVNIIDKIKEVLENFNEYQEVRREGMEFVRKNFSINTRLQKAKKILENL